MRARSSDSHRKHISNVTCRRRVAYPTENVLLNAPVRAAPTGANRYVLYYCLASADASLLRYVHIVYPCQQLQLKPNLPPGLAAFPSRLRLLDMTGVC